MADKDEDSLIGYDPLAWMHESDAKEAFQNDTVGESELQDTAFENSTAAILDPEIKHDQAPISASEASADEQQERGILVLEPVLNIQNVTVLHQRLTQMLKSFDAIDIDASNVTMIDTATLQLLLISKQTAIGLEKSISIDFPSNKFIEASELLGVAEMLSVDNAASGFF
jgi:ABC-type transporter Mla MlaB component